MMIAPMKTYIERRTSFTSARKRTIESAPRLSVSAAPARRIRSTCRMNSASHATASDARSRRKRPGITRRSGFTAKSVSAMVNCAIGLRVGARNTCIQKRTRTARMNRWKSASRTKAMACVSTSVLSVRRAQLTRTLARGLHRLDEARLHLGTLQHFESALGRPALGGNLRAQARRALRRALDRELRRADERPQRKRARGPGLEPELGRGRFQRLDGIEDISRAASRHRRDGVEVALVLEPECRAHCAEELLRGLSIRFGNRGQREEARDAGVHQRRRIRHRAHQAVAAGEPPREIRKPD